MNQQTESNEPTNRDDLGPECAWSGEHHGGKHYVLQTTEGPEVVSEKAFRSGGQADEDTAALRKQLRDLARRVDQLEKGAAAKVPGQRKTSEK